MVGWGLVATRHWPSLFLYLKFSLNIHYTSDVLDGFLDVG